MTLFIPKGTIMMRFSVRRLSFGLILAALLAAPRPAAALACGAVTDTDPTTGQPRITFNGSAGKQTLVVEAEQAQTTVSLDCNGNGKFTDTVDLDNVVFAQPFGTYVVNLLGGDTITFDIPSDWNGATKNLQVVLLGTANVVNLTSSNGATLTNSGLNMAVAGYLGIDKVSVTTPPMSGSRVVVRSDLSFGDDTMTVTLGGPVTNGSVVDVDATLDLGTNNFVFNQPAGSTITDSTVTLFAEGGYNTDILTANIKQGVGAGGRLFVNGDLSRGVDRFVGNIDLTTFQIAAGGEVHIDVDGGRDNDQLTLTRGGTSIAGGAPIAGLFDVRLNGGDGVDTMAVDLSNNALQLDGGTFALRANGGSASDAMTFDIGADASSTDPHFDIAVLGGGSNDKITFNLVNNGPNLPANYGPAGFVLIQGGAQSDTCKIGATNNSLFKKRDCEIN